METIEEEAIAENYASKACKKAATFIVENFLLVGFCGAVLIAFLYPFGGKLFYSWMTGDFHIIELLNNCLVFFISGVTLKLEELKVVLKYKLTIVYSLLTINFLTTLLAFVLINLPYLTKDFATGVVIFATVPTTLGVGVALTQISKGDQVLSLFLTVVSNLLGIVTVPFLLRIYLANNASNVTVDPVKLAFKLTITVLIPSVFGMCIRRSFSVVPAITKKYKTELSMFSTFNLVMIVWMALSSARNNLLVQKVGEIFFVIAVAVIMHCLYLAFNALMVSKWVLNLPVKQAVSVIIMASQKSSPVALAVITSIAATDPQQKGLFAIPCVVGQLTQIFIGSFLAKKLSAWVTSEEVNETTADDTTAIGSQQEIVTEEKDCIPSTFDDNEVNEVADTTEQAGVELTSTSATQVVYQKIGEGSDMILSC